MEQKLSTDGSRYNIVQAQAIVNELREIQQSLSSGQRERTGLMHSLAKLKDDLTRLQLCSATDDPDLQNHSSSTQLSDKLSTASQTDLSGEVCTFDRLLIYYKNYCFLTLSINCLSRKLMFICELTSLFGLEVNYVDYRLTD